MSSNPEDFNQRVFLAALQGLIANKDFHGPGFQGRSDLAVLFAVQVVRELKNIPDWRSEP
jgi:hypothetical protein